MLSALQPQKVYGMIPPLLSMAQEALVGVPSALQLQTVYGIIPPLLTMDQEVLVHQLKLIEYGCRMSHGK